MAANLCLSLVSLILFYALGCILGFTSMASALFAGFAALSLLRWFARAYGYANDAPWRTIISDLAYSLVLVAGVASIWFTGRLSLASASFVIALAAVAGLLPFGAPYFRQQLLDFSPRNLIAYRSIWREHSRWALVGVITTEATGNAHAYIVTLAAGPAAFARIAVSALLVRPIQVAMNALSEYERPQLARSIAGGQTEVMRSLRVFRLVLAAAWLGTAALAVLVLTGAPHAIFSAKYTVADLVLGATLWLAVAAARALRIPESTLLQAVGQFRSLAFASVYTCGISVLSVAGFLVLGGPLWSVAGILIGEVLFAYFTWREVRKWRRSATAIQ